VALYQRRQLVRAAAEIAAEEFFVGIRARRLRSSRI
jgi:hypothetical protein